MITTVRQLRRLLSVTLAEDSCVLREGVISGKMLENVEDEMFDRKWSPGDTLVFDVRKFLQAKNDKHEEYHNRINSPADARMRYFSDETTPEWIITSVVGPGMDGIAPGIAVDPPIFFNTIFTLFNTIFTRHGTKDTGARQKFNFKVLLLKSPHSEINFCTKIDNASPDWRPDTSIPEDWV